MRRINLAAKQERAQRELAVWNTLDLCQPRLPSHIAEAFGYTTQQVTRTLICLRNEGMVRKLPQGWCRNPMAYGSPQGRRHIVGVVRGGGFACSCGWTGSEAGDHKFGIVLEELRR